MLWAEFYTSNTKLVLGYSFYLPTIFQSVELDDIQTESKVNHVAYTRHVRVKPDWMHMSIEDNLLLVSIHCEYFMTLN